MGGLKEFKIPFTSLKDGSHDFKFEVTSSFFEAFPYSEIKKGTVHIDVTLVKHFHIMTLTIVMKGEVEQVCDRCGNDYQQPVQGERTLVVHLNADSFEDEDDLISLPESVHALDLSQYLYEYISLLVPSRRVCGGKPEGSNECDPEMIEKLEKLRAGSDSEEEEKPIDPRWDSLKNLKFDN
ncbi:MAG: DUF177 domain-containing protein [Bacteroidetes bacterium]|jgi:uncharacterized metal-binding protein YceD (DUF177 family)|nr:DUF177 domain-containing protein [Bacteroidota bacterium]